MKLLAAKFLSKYRLSFNVCCNIKFHFKALWVLRATERSRSELDASILQKSAVFWNLQVGGFGRALLGEYDFCLPSHFSVC